MKPYSDLIILPVFLFFLCSNASSATIYVPDDHATIQEAIDASVDDDKIIVREGTYPENIDFLGKSITVQAETGPSFTHIDGMRSGSVVTFKSGEGADSVLGGFTIFNGTGTALYGNDRYGGGICCRSSSPTITGNTLEYNYADHGGGVSFFTSSSPTLTGNVIRRNTANDSGAGIYCYEAGPSIVDNLIEKNNAPTDGGGIYCNYYSPATIKDNTIRLNSGGGIHCYCSSPLIAGNIIEDNTGGGIYCYAFDSMTIEDNVICRNSAWSGGGIYCENDLLTLRNNDIRDNTATSYGGGIRCGGAMSISNNRITGNAVTDSRYWDGGGGISCFSHTTAEITDNLITGNSAPHGGGITCTDYSSPLMSRNIVSRNMTSELGFGGGIFISLCSSPILSDLIVAENTAGYGGGIYCSDTSCPDITNCTIIGNSAELYGGGLCAAGCSSPTMTNTILWLDTAVLAGSEIALFWCSNLDIDFSDLQSGESDIYISPTSTYAPGAGMIDADPLFADPSVADFHLTYDSPCRNAGDAAAPGLPDVDFENDPRVHDGAPDMGADEFHSHLYFTGDAVPGAVVKVRIVGRPGVSPVTLGLGSGILDPPESTPYGDLYLAQPVQQFDLGTIPQSGILTTTALIPGSWTPGELRPFQALLGPLGPPGSILTNLVVVTVLENTEGSL